MRALYLEDGLLRLASRVDDPRPGPGEVLVRVTCAGICGADLELTRGYKKAAFAGCQVTSSSRWSKMTAGLVVLCTCGPQASPSPVIASKHTAQTDGSQSETVSSTDSQPFSVDRRRLVSVQTRKNVQCSGICFA